MADLGTVVTAVANPKVSFVIANWHSGAPVLRQSFFNMGIKARDVTLKATATAGTFTGSVKEGGTAVPNCIVRVYERESGRFVAETLTDSSGNFTFPYMRQGVNDYYVIALDPDGGALYNALIFDRVAPV